MKTDEHQRRPRELVREARQGHLLGFRPGTQRGLEGGQAVADVGPEHDRDAGVEAEEPLGRKGHRQTDGGGGGMGDRRHHDGAQEAHHGSLGQTREDGAEQRMALQERGTVQDRPQTEEHQPEAEHAPADGLERAASPEEHQPEAQRHGQQGIIGHPKGQQLGGERGPDVRPQDESDGLPDGEKSCRHEADGEHRHRRGRLDDAGDQRAGQEGRDTISREARQEPPQTVSRDPLQALGRELSAMQEERHTAKHENEPAHVTMQCRSLPRASVSRRVTSILSPS